MPILRDIQANYNMEARALTDLREVSLAVVGAPAVGKSTFIQCSLDLKRASASPVISKKVSLEGTIYVVRLVELGLEKLQLSANQPLCWPQTLGQEPMPDIDGVLVLFNVMDHSSIDQIPAFLSECSSSTFQYLCKQ